MRLLGQRREPQLQEVSKYDMAINQDRPVERHWGALVWWMVLGTLLGWMPAGGAEQQAVERANTAVLDVLTPICVARFHQDSESKAQGAEGSARMESRRLCRQTRVGDDAGE